MNHKLVAAARAKLHAPVPGEVEPIETGRRQYGRLIYERNFTYPGGRVERFFLFGVRGGKMPSMILPITKREEVVALVQYRHGVCDFVVEAPGGNPDEQEKPEEVIHKELLEETGYAASRILSLGNIYIDAPTLNVSMNFFLGFGCEMKTPPNREGSEVIETIVVPLEDWLRMATDGTIRDSKTIALTMMALPYLGRAIR